MTFLFNADRNFKNEDQMKNEYDKTIPHPCHSGNPHGVWCKDFHEGQRIDTSFTKKKLF